jgi:hypothetical protein
MDMVSVFSGLIRGEKSRLCCLRESAGAFCRGLLACDAFAVERSRPKIILSSEAINYHRGRKKVSLLWNTIQDIELRKGCLLVSNRSIAGGKVRLKLRGLERGPAEILYMIRPLFAVTQSSN